MTADLESVPPSAAALAGAWMGLLEWIKVDIGWFVGVSVGRFGIGFGR